MSTDHPRLDDLYGQKNALGDARAAIIEASRVCIGVVPPFEVTVEIGIGKS